MPSPKVLSTAQVRGLEDNSERNSGTYDFDAAKEWKLFCDGSEAAFVKIYNHYFQMLYNLGRQFSGDNELLKDTLQETFIKIREKRSKLHKVVSAKAFLIKCYRNNIITEQKKRKKDMTLNFALAPFAFHLTPSHESVLINRRFEDDQIKLIQESLNKLTRRQREAIYYLYYNGLTYAQIKDVMGFASIRAARNLIYRSLTELKKQVEILGAYEKVADK
ncbi:RNA polymerase sigma factor [Flagellimonas myxillae]|uniref:RNA polymerase sigma factor n=1 Tax=Flagellimonas myxillae TaxID=2942214 RepID=UPI00201EF339|nr:RNA polymerase sigma factor [Muricauda myxillae]MCL6265446.1 RNA polymerase sigma factor [Muricauda myxillae]